MRRVDLEDVRGSHPWEIGGPPGLRQHLVDNMEVPVQPEDRKLEADEHHVDGRLVDEQEPVISAEVPAEHQSTCPADQAFADLDTQGRDTRACDVADQRKLCHEGSSVHPVTVMFGGPSWAVELPGGECHLDTICPRNKSP